MNKLMIDKLVLVVIRDNKILITLGKGQDNWHIPTTQRDQADDNDTDVAALTRLAKTELNAELKTGSVRHYGTFEVHAHAHGMNPEKTDKAEVRLKAYVGELDGNPEPGDKVEKLQFVFFNQKHLVLQAYNAIFDELQKKGLIG